MAGDPFSEPKLGGNALWKWTLRQSKHPPFRLSTSTVLLFGGTTFFAIKGSWGFDLPGLGLCAVAIWLTWRPVLGPWQFASHIYCQKKRKAEASQV